MQNRKQLNTIEENRMQQQIHPFVKWMTHTRTCVYNTACIKRWKYQVMDTQGAAFDLLFHDLPGMSFLLTPSPPLPLLAQWLSAAGLMTWTAHTEHARAVVCCQGESRQQRQREKQAMRGARWETVTLDNRGTRFSSRLFVSADSLYIYLYIYIYKLPGVEHFGMFC